MSDLKLDANGDLEVIDGELVLVTGREAVAQDVTTRLRTIKGEWFLDERIGMPFIEDILVKGADLSLVRQIYTQACLDTTLIAEVLNMELETTGDRRLKITDLELRMDPTVDDDNAVLTFTPFILNVSGGS